MPSTVAGCYGPRKPEMCESRRANAGIHVFVFAQKVVDGGMLRHDVSDARHGFYHCRDAGFARRTLRLLLPAFRTLLPVSQAVPSLLRRAPAPAR